MFSYIFSIIYTIKINYTNEVKNCYKLLSKVLNQEMKLENLNIFFLNFFYSCLYCFLELI